MNRRVILLTMGLTVLFSSASAVAEKRIWACKVSPDAAEDLWLVEMSDSIGYVKLYDNRIWGNFTYEGEDRRWDFDRRRDGLARYSAILKPDNTLDYYDFENAKAGEELAPAYNYTCRKAD